MRPRVGLPVVIRGVGCDVLCNVISINFEPNWDFKSPLVAAQLVLNSKFCTGRWYCVHIRGSQPGPGTGVCCFKVWANDRDSKLTSATSLS